jgi:starch synthase (maltosyl-transferring)
VITERRRPPSRTADAFPHIAVAAVTPEVDAGRFPITRVVGGTVAVGADVFKEGHDLLRARVRYRGPGTEVWSYAPLAHDVATDRWRGAFAVDAVGRWTYTVEAWTDLFGTWRSGLAKKVAAGQEVGVELLEGAQFVERTTRPLRAGEARRALEEFGRVVGDTAATQEIRVAAALAPELLALMEEHFPPEDLTAYARELAVTVDRPAAAFAAWYEFFPRSEGSTPEGRHGTFAASERGKNSYHAANAARSRSTVTASSRG